MKIKVHSYEVSATCLGEGDETVLLVHGGPGIPSNYLIDSHTFLIDHGFKIATWDQLGCGLSDKPDDPSLWRLERFVEEVEIVRSALNLGKVYLLGHSWGGMLGLAYCLKYPDNVKAFIAANTAFDLTYMQRGFERKKLALGEETFTMMGRREAEGTTDHPEYKAAVTLLMYRHMCRAEKWPDVLNDCFANIAMPVLSAMFGPHPFNCSGNLRDLNWIDQLPHMKIPTLILHSEYDYMLPDIALLAKEHLPNGELVMLRGCSHLPFFEDPKAYQEALLNYLHFHNLS